MESRNLVRAYATLWVLYCAAGLPYGQGPQGVARWAYGQAVAVVCPATARRIAAAVYAAGAPRAARVARFGTENAR